MRRYETRMSTDHRFDQTAARQFEAIYSVPKVVARRRRTLDLLAPQLGAQVLDIGCGPGYFAAEIAERVGHAGQVWGIDASDSMLALAERTCADLPQVDLRLGDARALPLPTASVDAALAVQVYIYVAEIATALAELQRVLKPGGWAIIADMDWEALIWHTADAARMARFKPVMYEHFVHPHLPRHLPGHLKQAGFTVQTIDTVVMLNTEIDPYVFGLMKLLGRFLTGCQGITAEEVAAWEADLTAQAKDGNYFFSVNQYLFLIEKP
jgi:arsenite methyltransferase